MKSIDEQLRKMGLQVEAFSSYHFRVSGQIDYWLPRGKWHDLLTGERGRKPLDQIPFFIKQKLDGRVLQRQDHDTFVRNLCNMGWNREEAEKQWNERESQASY